MRLRASTDIIRNDCIAKAQSNKKFYVTEVKDSFDLGQFKGKRKDNIKNLE